MNVTQAAEEWAAYQRKKAAWLARHGPEPKAAATVLKEWFRTHPDKRSFRDVSYSSTPTERLDLDLVRAELDPKVLARCKVSGTRETLSLIERPAAAKPTKKAAAKKPAAGAERKAG